MHLTSGFTAAAVLAGAAVGFAGPACADDLDGAYTIMWSDGKAPATWTFTPCGPGCRHVTSSKGWSTDAQLVNGSWIMGPVQNTVHCWSGTIETATENSSFDAATLSGTSVVTYPVSTPPRPSRWINHSVQFDEGEIRWG